MNSYLVHMSSLFSDECWSPENVLHIDLQNLNGTTCYCDPDSEAAIVQAFEPYPLKALHWIDGGDYHYLTDIWMRKLSIPTEMVLFDHHPDDQEPAFGADILSCGGWVAHSRKSNPMLRNDSSNIYISIDLDYLSVEYARTNWDQGTASLDQLLGELESVMRGKTIAGIDICGGITAAQGGKASDFEINRRTRNILMDFFQKY